MRLPSCRRLSPTRAVVVFFSSWLFASLVIFIYLDDQLAGQLSSRRTIHSKNEPDKHNFHKAARELRFNSKYEFLHALAHVLESGILNGTRVDEIEDIANAMFHDNQHLLDAGMEQESESRVADIERLVEKIRQLKQRLADMNNNQVLPMRMQL